MTPGASRRLRSFPRVLRGFPRSLLGLLLFFIGQSLVLCQRRSADAGDGDDFPVGPRFEQFQGVFDLYLRDRRPAFPESVPGPGDGFPGGGPLDDLRPFEFGDGQEDFVLELPDGRVIEGVPVPADVQDIHSDVPLGQFPDNPLAFLGVAGEPVELGAEQLVAALELGDEFLEFRSARRLAGILLGDDVLFGDAGFFEFLALVFQGVPLELYQGRDPGVSVFHGPSSLVIQIHELHGDIGQDAGRGTQHGEQAAVMTEQPGLLAPMAGEEQA